MKRRKTVLFVCTHNSARSQMAEGFVNALFGDKYEAHSAGTKPSTVSRYAVEVMAEEGIDISGHRSKNVAEYSDRFFDLVVTLCDSAKEECPYFPNAKKIIHKSFNNPSTLSGSEEEKKAGYRKVRDEIKKWVIKEFGGGK